MDYNELLFHIVSHHVNKSEHYMWDVLVEYLKTHWEAIAQVSGEFVDHKEINLEDYKDFINQDGKRGDKLSVYLLARMANLAITVVMENGIWSTFDGLVNEAELVLVYLGHSVFLDTVPLSQKNQNCCQKMRRMNMKIKLLTQIDVLQGLWVM